MRRAAHFLPAIIYFTIVSGSAHAALAQTKQTWLNLGVGVTTFQSTKPGTHSDNLGVGIAWRIGHGGGGWTKSIGFGWYETGLRTSVAGLETRVGSIHVRPIMFGYGYTVQRGRAAVEMKTLGGYSFNTISVDNQLRQNYLNAFDTWVSGNIHNSWVVEPEASLWYDLTSRVGVNVSLGYMLNRPIVVLTTGSGPTPQRWNADMVVMSFGVVYGIF
jgi:hypothetical protein